MVKFDSDSQKGKGNLRERYWRRGAFSMAARAAVQIVPVHVGAKRDLSGDVTIVDPDSLEMGEAISTQAASALNSAVCEFSFPVHEFERQCSLQFRS